MLEDSCEDSSSEDELPLDSEVDRGASAGALSVSEEVVVPEEVLVASEDALADSAELVPELSALLADALVVLPGKACAATSASTAARATLPAISQRFTRLSLRRAASRLWLLGRSLAMQPVCVG